MSLQQSQLLQPVKKLGERAVFPKSNWNDEAPKIYEEEKPSHIQREDWQNPTADSLK